MFPEVLVPDANGRVHVGGTLDVPTIVEAYQRRGIFPWRGGANVPWYLPEPRAVLPAGTFVASTSLAKLRRRGELVVAFDRDIAGAQQRCATVERKWEKQETWITPDMMAVYGELAALGIAHAVEVYRDGVPVGGLYGLTFGRFFHGESMYFIERDASKLALWALSDALAARGFELIDCQVPTTHMTSLGVKSWTSARYLERLGANRDAPSAHHSWADWWPATTR